MAVIAEVTLRGITPEQYDAVRARTGWVERVPAGELVHLTWWEGTDCHSVDAWESEAAFGAFAERRLGPGMTAAGIDGAPEVRFHPAHEVLRAARGLVAATPTAILGEADDLARTRTGYACYAAGDIPAVLALLSEHIRWSTPSGIGCGGVYRGRDGVWEFFTRLQQNVAELRVEPEGYIDAGDTIVVQGMHRGRTVAGNPFEVPFLHVWTWCDGLAMTFTELTDSALVARALGELAPVRTPATAGAPA